MTATRWWVRLAARWLARLDGVQGQVQMFSLAVTAFSTFSLVLQNAGLGRAVPYVGVGALIAGVVYTYLYTEGGVWNQVARDRHDMSGNWAGPGERIRGELIARGLAAAEKGEPLSDEERAAVSREVEQAFGDLRDGVELTDGGTDE